MRLRTWGNDQRFLPGAGSEEWVPDADGCWTVDRGPWTATVPAEPQLKALMRSV